MEKNKTGKYLKYAIGEIVLVVIGILIALEINDWNENRKDNEIARTYYHQLLNDFENDKIYLTEFISEIDSFSTRYQSYKETFENPDISLWKATGDIGKVYTSEAGKGWNFEMNSTTISTLQTSGDIKILPVGIKNKLLEFNVKQACFIDYMKTMATNLANRALETSKLYGGADLSSRMGNQPKLITYFSDKNIEIQVFLELESILYENMLMGAEANERMKELIIDIDALTMDINDELKK